MTALFPILCIIFLFIFIAQESGKHYLSAVCLKGIASACFVLFGWYCGRFCPDADFARLILIGLILGFVADILLNLRFVVPEKYSQPVFLVGILVFLAGHIVYLCALVRDCRHVPLCFIVGAVLTAVTMYLLFQRITAKPAFKIFGVFYIGAIMLMTCTAAGVFFETRSVHGMIFLLGALFFLVSDIVLILNTFGSAQKQSLRIVNLSLYYLGQLMIGLSLMLFRI